MREYPSALLGLEMRRWPCRVYHGVTLTILAILTLALVIAAGCGPKARWVQWAHQSMEARDELGDGAPVASYDIEGDRATVKYKSKASGDKTLTAEVVKENGAWKIDKF